MKKIIDLGMHPYADTFISKNQQDLSEPVYNLQCGLDEDTGEVRLMVDTKADERYNLYNYSYTSSNSSFSRNHWNDYASTVNNKLNLNSPSKILEIGSNDGYLSSQFSKCGHKVIGVDPSLFMCDLANSLGIDTCNALFDKSLSQSLKEDIGEVDLVVANNVFNHTNDTDDFIQGVANILNAEGCFVFELPYWLCTIRDKKFDQIYHEHVTYFTVKYSQNLLSKVGMTIQDVEVVDYHGGSLRVYAGFGDKISEKVKKLIKEEEDFGLFRQDTYVNFMKEITEKRNKFMKNIYEIKSKGYPIVAVGAAAKGNTLLNFYNLDNSIIDYVTDSSEYKKGKYTPLTRIPITGDEIFENYENVYALILSWNISTTLIDKIKKINNKVEFLVP